MCCPDQSSYELASSASLLEGNRCAGVPLSARGDTNGKPGAVSPRAESFVTLCVERCRVRPAGGADRSKYGGGFPARSDCHLRTGPGQCELSQQEVLTLSSSSGISGSENASRQSRPGCPQARGEAGGGS